MGSSLLSARLTIRPLMDSDRTEMIRVLHVSRRHLDRHIPLQSADETASQAFDRALELTRRGMATGSAWRRVGINAAGRIVCGCAVYGIERGFTMEASIHWWVSADALGKSYGKEMVSAAIAHATADLPHGLGLLGLNAAISPENEASITLAEAVGFHRVGRSVHPMLVGDRWERMDSYRLTAAIPDVEPTPRGQGAISIVSGTVGSGVASIPGRVISVPSRATRS